MKILIKILLFNCCILIGTPLFSQRNVVLIIADDIGTDYFGFYEDAKDTVDVPNLRTLVNKGIRFSNAMSNPLCSSTRAGILTGRYSFRTGVGGVVSGTGGSGTLDTSELTIPLLLKRYNPNIVTANIGKWHLHSPMPVANLKYPNKLGYDHYEGSFIGQLQSFTNWTKHTNGTGSTVTNYATTENVTNAITWLKLQKGNPFFLWLAFNAPHSPYHLPPAHLHRYSGLSGTQQHINQNPKLYFKAALQALDTELGRFFDSLKTINVYDSTDFIFIGDNGNAGQTVQIADRNKAKGSIYQYGVHVPFIVAGPSVQLKATSTHALVNTADIFSTILEMMGNENWQSQISIQKPADSKSFLPIVKGEKKLIRSWTFCELFQIPSDSAHGKSIRNIGYKLLRFDDGREEFYNLAEDPLEVRNLLLHNLSAEEQLQYDHLCNELAMLLSQSKLCAFVAVQDPKYSIPFQVVPNPFSDFLKIIGTEKKLICSLYSTAGNIIYKGENLHEQNFDHIEPGIYYLKVVTPQHQIFKLIKL